MELIMYGKQAIVLVLGISGASVAAADQLEIFVSERAVQAGYDWPIRASNADVSVAGFFNEDDDIMLNGGLVVSGQPAGQLPLSFDAGAKAYVFSLDDADEDLAVGALGGLVRYTIPANIPMHVSAEAFYAPEILTTSAGDSMLDTNMRFEVEFIPRTTGFVGYRMLEVDLNGGRDVELDDNLHVGLRLTF
jgi:hypothetical protein